MLRKLGTAKICKYPFQYRDPTIQQSASLALLFGCDPFWNEPSLANGIIHVDECSKFHHLWFAICLLPVRGTEFTIEELFGEV
uniref:Uncharacterized protein n=1 Tax=Glossina palpalis gambiensis TaxID=67801 RepID=A0A1B0BGD3_9MUSC